MAEMNGCSCCAVGEGEGEGEGSALPTHLRPAHWGRSAHIMRAIVVAIGVKEDAQARKVVPRPKDRT